jgi:hypothetical protein
LKSRPSRRVRVFDIRIQFDRHPTGVTNLAERRYDRRKIDRTGSRNQVMMYARGRNVFQMDVPNVLRQLAN